MTLIELMIAMLLGLIIIGTVISVILAGRQSYLTNEALSQVQESARTSFELLARDIRQAASSGCGNTRIANTVDVPVGTWWGEWVAIRGYDGATAAPAVAFGAGVGARVAGTGAVLLQGTDGAGLGVESHDVPNFTMDINAAATDFAVGDVLMVCDFDHATIFRVTGYDNANVRVTHDIGAPGAANCSRGLGFPTDCSSATGNAYQFGPNSHISRMNSVTWYIGNNGRDEEGGRSLYRVRLGPGAALVTEEIVSGVSDMQVLFRQQGDAILTAAPANWDAVTAVEVTFTLDSVAARVSSDLAVNEGRLQRNFSMLVGLRNRVE